MRAGLRPSPGIFLEVKNVADDGMRYRTYYDERPIVDEEEEDLGQTQRPCCRR